MDEEEEEEAKRTKTIWGSARAPHDNHIILIRILYGELAEYAFCRLLVQDMYLICPLSLSLGHCLLALHLRLQDARLQRPPILCNRVWKPERWWCGDTERLRLSNITRSR